MKILFVFSERRGIMPQVRAQALALYLFDGEVESFIINDKGIIGYFKNIPKLKKQILIFKPDIIHSHYSFCGIIASLAAKKIPVVASLMGSDTYQSKLMKLTIRYFANYRWSKTIVKSEDMKIRLGLNNAVILPNGVDLNLFKPLDKKECRNKLGWDLDKKYILFASNPARPEKNFALAKQIVENLNNDKIILKVVYDVDHKLMPIYLNAADVLLLTSKWEGSPNIVKEAMACNIPAVVTKVGDIEFLFGNIEGYYYTNPLPDRLAEKINYILDNELKLEGRQRIIDLNLDYESFAEKLIYIYQELL